MDHTIVHFEIPADDPERAARFYRELFGWDVQKWDGGEAGAGASAGGGGETAAGSADASAMEYWMVMTVPANEDSRPARAGVNGGMMRRQHAEQPPVNYVSVESVDEYVDKARRLGAELIAPKQAVSTMGWFALLKDPERNVFGVWEANQASR